MLGVKSYLDFVRYCIDEQQCVPTITDWLRQTNGWNALFLFMQQQALVGVGFCGLEKMKAAGVDVPREVVLKWYAMSEQIRQRNVEMNKKCVELTEILRKDGYESCILKGQGNAMMYPDPLLRQPGDIDVWVKPVSAVNDQGFVVREETDNVKWRRRMLAEYVKRRFPNTRIRYQHIDFPVFPGVEVEMHFIPTAKNNPIYNKRIQRWVEERMEEQFRHIVDMPDGVGQIAVPTTEFNVIYQLSHLMHHFFDEGIGLRQMMDYYYLLRKVQGSRFKVQGSTKSFEETLKYLNLYKFAGAVMWVLHEVFGMEEDYYLVPPDEWRGKLLLDEILKGGNFGKYSGLTNHSTGVKYFLKIKRNLRFVRAYPSEALCEPFFRTWHFFWRVMHS